MTLDSDIVTSMKVKDGFCLGVMEQMKRNEAKILSRLELLEAIIMYSKTGEIVFLRSNSER